MVTRLTNGLPTGLGPHLPSIPLKTLHASHSIPSRSQQWRTVLTRSIASVLVTRPRSWANLLLCLISFRKILTHSLKPWVISSLKHLCAWTDHRSSKPWWEGRMLNTTRTSRRWLILLTRVRSYDHFVVFFPSYWMLSVGCCLKLSPSARRTPLRNRICLTGCCIMLTLKLERNWRMIISDIMYVIFISLFVGFPNSLNSSWLSWSPVTKLPPVSNLAKYPLLFPRSHQWYFPRYPYFRIIPHRQKPRSSKETSWRSRWSPWRRNDHPERYGEV